MSTVLGTTTAMAWDVPASAPTDRAEAAVIDTSNRAAVRRAYRTQYLTSVRVRPRWTGSVGACRIGTTSRAYRAATLRLVNYFRGLAGLRAVVFAPALTRRSQAAALMMDAANALSHSPDRRWPCYSRAGRQGASRSALCLGCAGASVIEGYVADPGAGNAAVGHRQWILFPPQTTMGVGSTGQADSLYVLDQGSWVRPAGPPRWVRWPPAGFVPRRHIYPRFSFSRANVDFRRATARVYLDGTQLPSRVVTRNGNYGDRVMVIEVNLKRLRAGKVDRDRRLRVVVRGLRINGRRASHTWRTIVISP
jgi:hypothetical protein